MILTGKVKSGKGDCAHWLEVLNDWYYAKTGLRLYPGSLNLALDRDYHLPKRSIRLEKEEYGGRVSVSMQPCTVFGRKAFILRTDLNASGKGDHPLSLIEIATDIGLRKAFGLSDGDSVDVCVEDEQESV